MKRKVVYVFTSCRKSGPIQVMYNLIANLNRELFEPIIVTIYNEREDSEIEKFKALGVECFFCPHSKMDIILNKTESLRKLIVDLKPSVVHSLGVFPDYAVSKMGFTCQMITLHCYMHEDYLNKFGIIRGNILKYLHKKALYKAKKVVTCSKSLSDMYKSKLNLSYDYICNGIDLNCYHMVSEHEKFELRKKLNIPTNKTVFVYAAQFIPRKNQEFLLRTFAETNSSKDVLLLLLGDGPDLPRLKKKYKESPQIDIRGMVTNVNEYLQASDVYISSSLSEGMPNGVLEAMASGLPVILSNIKQHNEIIQKRVNIGFSYEQGNMNDLSTKIQIMLSENMKSMGKNAYEAAHQEFDAILMSKRYQKVYEEIMER